MTPTEDITRTPATIELVNGKRFRALDYDIVETGDVLAVGLFDDGSGTQVIGHVITTLFMRERVDHLVLGDPVTTAETMTDEEFADLDAQVGGSA